MASAIQITSFINQIGPLVQREAKNRGYKFASPIIAQACIESNFGVSQLSSKYHNYFGLKCGKYWKGKSVNLKTREEYSVGTLTTISDNFRVYDDMLSGVAGYFDFINTPRYANLRDALSPLDYLQKIKADGYATSSSYVNTCMNCINKYNLTQFDGNAAVGNPYSAPTTILKRGSTGNGVRYVQYELVNKYGYPLTIDGAYGPKTEAAIRDFQTKKFVDGICGPLTLGKLKE